MAKTSQVKGNSGVKNRVRVKSNNRNSDDDISMLHYMRFLPLKVPLRLPPSFFFLRSPPPQRNPPLLPIIT